MNRSVREWLETFGGRALGVVGGLLLALAVLQYGLLRTVFILLVVAVGYWIGQRIDESGGLREFLQRVGRD